MIETNRETGVPIRSQVLCFLSPSEIKLNKLIKRTKLKTFLPQHFLTFLKMHLQKKKKNTFHHLLTTKNNLFLKQNTGKNLTLGSVKVNKEEHGARVDTVR